MAASVKGFLHPMDAKAIQVIKNIPGYEKVAKWLMTAGIEQYYHSVLIADHVKLSPTQLPKVYELLPPICKKFGIDVPELFLQMDPNPGAFTVGDKKAIIVLTSGLLDHVTDEKELQAVLAHECGHIVCRHVLYSSLLNILVTGNMIPFETIGKSIANGALEVAETIPGISTALKVAGFVTANAYMGLLLALQYWSRCSELSCDRASVVFCGNPEVPSRALLRLAAGPSRITADINLQEYAHQIHDKAAQSRWQKILRGAKSLFSDHPFFTFRLNEMMKFASSREFPELIGSFCAPSKPDKACPSCGKPVTKRQKFCRYCGSRI